MQRFLRLVPVLLIWAAALTGARAQRALTWEEVRDRFDAHNPTLRAGEIGVEQSRAQEITARLRPNPEITGMIDQVNPFTAGPYRPLTYALPFVSTSYLFERNHKRDLRGESARRATAVAESQAADERRTLLFALRTAFVQALQAKAVLAVARENLAYYDRLLTVSNDRYRAGDIAQVDLDRLQLQRVQFEADAQTAETNVRTAKIQLLALINERTPVERFDVAGTFDFIEPLTTIEELRSAATDARPDLQAARRSIERAQADYRLALANGSTDPTFGVDLGRNPPIPGYLGMSVNIPLRIFDRNQGEKARTALEVRRGERLREAAEAQVFSDVDSAWTTLNSSLTLLRPYKTAYLAQAARVRDAISFSYQRGGASLLDFLAAQNEYRSVQLSYLNLVGAYLSAANQLNLAVGREVIP